MILRTRVMGEFVGCPPLPLVTERIRFQQFLQTVSQGCFFHAVHLQTAVHEGGALGERVKGQATLLRLRVRQDLESSVVTFSGARGWLRVVGAEGEAACTARSLGSGGKGGVGSDRQI